VPTTASRRARSSSSTLRRTSCTTVRSARRRCGRLHPVGRRSCAPPGVGPRRRRWPRSSWLARVRPRRRLYTRPGHLGFVPAPRSRPFPGRPRRRHVTLTRAGPDVHEDISVHPEAFARVRASVSARAASWRCSRASASARSSWHDAAGSRNLRRQHTSQHRTSGPRDLRSDARLAYVDMDRPNIRDVNLVVRALLMGLTHRCAAR
jgi:hypothetical protein